MAKYDPLREHLRHSPGTVSMTLEEIADLVGGLPPSAYQYTAWWHDFDERHTQSRSWNDAGFRALPDLRNRRVRFERTTA